MCSTIRDKLRENLRQKAYVAAMRGATAATTPLAILLQISLLTAAGQPHPIVVIPGLASTQLYARLTAAYRPSNAAVCGANRPAGWFRLWKNTKLLREPLVQCFSEQMSIHYDPTLDDYRNTHGVETAVPHFGSVEAFRHRDPDDLEDGHEIGELLERLEAFGYRDGKNLFGAPYDFRYGLAAPGHPSRVGSRFLDALRALVEQAAFANGGSSVVILAHSMGGLLAHQLLTRIPLPWRRRFVKSLVTTGTPWGGTVLEMEVFATGPPVAGLAPTVLRAERRSYESNLWLLPSPRAFGGRPLVVTPTRNYSAVLIPRFLADVGLPEAVHPYRSRILPLVVRLDPPGVPVTCILGTGIPTVGAVVYEDGFDQVSEVVFRDGDGTVNLESSLAAAAEWSEVAEQPLKVIRVPNATHGSILLDEVTWREIMEQVYSDGKPTVLSFAAA